MQYIGFTLAAILGLFNLIETINFIILINAHLSPGI
jgi:hypothetical protein